MSYRGREFFQLLSPSLRLGDKECMTGVHLLISKRTKR